MTLVNTETGELVEPLSREEAERLSTRIRLRLDAIADNYSAVMPMIREAIEREAHVALGYPSVSAYVSNYFGDALSKLGVEVRREVVRELTAAGMSTRAIAPVVGVSRMTVARDVDSPVTHVTPEVPQGGEASPSQGETAAREIPRPAVQGIDGKTYTRPEPRAPQRRALPDQAADAGFELRKAAERIERVFADDRMPTNKQQVSTRMRGDLLFTARAVAAALAVLDSDDEKDTADD